MTQLSESTPGEYVPDAPEPYADNIPENLKASSSRLRFPPSYVVVGVYRLFTDKNLYVPAWQKCQHGAVRGAGVGLFWAFMTFKIQRKFVEIFLIKSPSVTGLSRDAVFGIQLPFDLPTYATLVFLSSQISAILMFFLSRNIRIARDRAYKQTIASRNKASDFWGPYVEEWHHSPIAVKKPWWSEFVVSTVGRIVVNAALTPFHLLPVVGILVSAWLKALGVGRHLHQPYFEAKNMTPAQIETFIEERKWDYRAFGFAASILEGLPILGILFTLSNRVGAAMWAVDLEKRQHFVAEQRALEAQAKARLVK